MKKIFSLFICIITAAVMLSGCSTPSIDTGSKKINIVATIFPEYDWVREIVGDESGHVNLTLLLDNGVDLHSYQPTADDIIKISTCDMFIYVGGESDKWALGALKEATNKDMTVISLLDVLGDMAKAEEVVEGMQDDEHEDEHDEHEIEYDEHVWLSLKNAAALCSYICDELCRLDAEHKDAYTANTAAYLSRLNALDEEYKSAVDTAPVKTVLFGGRFPFRYMTDDYGLDYYAAFTGCSAETEASFETIIFLADKVDELGLHSILQIESADGTIANTIKDNTAAKNQTILTMDSLQSATSADIKSGKTYLSVMQQNLDILKDALK
ncbi:MAG: zinc ABC transporter substrate-binding protein [Lachnospiraceae bacterium]|nr:zinc ABC transporter substrate-binding protein [Lachnospiraceae bacterium]